jgi:hypothetical protein
VIPTLRLREAVIGSGGKCGSVALDRAFLNLVETRIGDAFKGWLPKKTGRGSLLMRAFEVAKTAFGTSAHTECWWIPVGNVEDDPANEIEDGEMKLTTYSVLFPLFFY